MSDDNNQIAVKVDVRKDMPLESAFKELENSLDPSIFQVLLKMMHPDKDADIISQNNEPVELTILCMLRKLADKQGLVYTAEIIGSFIDNYDRRMMGLNGWRSKQVIEALTKQLEDLQESNASQIDKYLSRQR